MRTKSPFLIAILWFAASAPLTASAFAQGFGSSHKQVILHRKLPPTANLKPGTIKVDPDMASQGDMARNIASSLQAELLKHGTGLSADSEHPQTVIRITVVSYARPEAQVTTVPGFDLGTRRATTEQMTRVQSSISVAFEARDTAAARTLDSDNVNAQYVGTFALASANSAGSFGSSQTGIIASGLMGGIKKLKKQGGSGATDAPPTNGEVQGKLLSSVVAQIAAHLVNTDESVPVLLARGKLDEANTLADSARWSPYLEKLEQMPPFSSPQEDAYRLYNIGVGYEASAYTAEDPKAATKFLDQAAINYGKAVSDKPDEKLFLEPQNRIETAIAHYKKLQDQQAAAAAPASAVAAATPQGRGLSAVPVAAAPTTAGSGDAATSKMLNNEQVISLAKAGMDDDNLIDTIKTAPAVDFDLSVPGLLSLTQGGVKGRVLTAMKTRARGPAATAKKK